MFVSQSVCEHGNNGTITNMFLSTGSFDSTKLMLVQFINYCTVLHLNGRTELTLIYGLLPLRNPSPNSSRTSFLDECES